MWHTHVHTHTTPLTPFQGVHEARGTTEDYLRLETLVQKVVSPYLGTYGLYSSEGPFVHSCILGRGRLGSGWGGLGPAASPQLSVILGTLGWRLEGLQAHR